jgi:hypothetical protein
MHSWLKSCQLPSHITGFGGRSGVSPPHALMLWRAVACCDSLVSCLPDALPFAQGPTVQPVQAAGSVPAAASPVQGHTGQGPVQQPRRLLLVSADHALAQLTVLLSTLSSKTRDVQAESRGRPAARRPLLSACGCAVSNGAGHASRPTYALRHASALARPLNAPLILSMGR